MLVLFFLVIILLPCINLRVILNIICHLHSSVDQTCKGQGGKPDQNNICCKRMLFTESIQMNHRFQQ